MGVLKLKGPNEKQIEGDILKYLSYLPGVFAFKVDTQGFFNAKTQKLQKARFGVRLGTPDILACVNCNSLPIFVGFEVKTEDGRQSEHQKAWQADLLKKGNGFYFLVRSVGDVEVALRLVRESVKF